MQECWLEYVLGSPSSIIQVLLLGWIKSGKACQDFWKGVLTLLVSTGAGLFISTGTASPLQGT